MRIHPSTMTTDSPAPPPAPRFSLFDGFQLDRHTGRLTRDGAVVALPEQAVQVLAALLEHPGEPVSRRSLQDLLWPGDTAGDFDNKLNGAASGLSSQTVLSNRSPVP